MPVEQLAILAKFDEQAAVRSIGKLRAASDKDLGAVEKKAAGLGDKVSAGAGRMGARLGGAIGVGIVLDQLNQAADKAMALNTQVKTSERVFGDADSAITEFGKHSATAIGMSEQAYRLNANRLGAMVTNLGFAQSEAAELSNSMMRVAADLGAAFGESPERAIEAIGAAMRGERDPIEAFGISLKQADIDAKVMAMGLDTGTAAAKKHADAVASVALIQEQAGKTAGAFADGVEDGSQRSVVAAAKWEDSMAKLGEAIVPLKNAASEIVEHVAGQFGEATNMIGGNLGGLDQQIQSAFKNFKADNFEGQKRRIQTVRDQIKGLQRDKENLSAVESAMGVGREYDDAIRDLQQLEAEEQAHIQRVDETGRVYGLTYDAAQKRVNGLTDATVEGAGKAGDATKTMLTPVKDLADAWGDAEKATHSYLDETTSVLDAQLDTQDALAEMAQTIRENGAEYDWVNQKLVTNTEKSRENMRTIQDVVRAYVDEDLALAKQTGSLEAGKNALIKHREQLVQNLIQLGYSERAANQYADQLGLIPGEIVTRWHSEGLAASLDMASRLLDTVSRLPNGQNIISGAQAGLAAARATNGTRTQGGNNTTVNVHGSVITERELADLLGRISGGSN